jgi:hypothetical protein
MWDNMLIIFSSGGWCRVIYIHPSVVYMQSH